MSEPEPPDQGLDPRIPTRPLWGFVLVLLPIIGIVLVVSAYVVIVGMGITGRSAQGDEVTWHFTGCEAAQPMIEARLDDIGLPSTWTTGPGTYTVTTRLTGDGTVDRSLPVTLTTPGALEVRGGSLVLASSEDVTYAGVRMDVFMVPSVLLRLDADGADRVKQYVRSEPEGRMEYYVDGQYIGWQSNTNPVSVGEVEINLEMDGDERARMQAVASWSVILDHAPLPCAVSVRGDAPPE